MQSMRALGVCLVAAATQFLPAQGYGNGSHGALAPTADVTLDTGANGGVFQFTSIAIPAGVTVHLIGPNPARLLCQGAVTIAGTLEGDGQGSLWLVNSHVYGQAGGPGGYAGAGSGSGGGPGGGNPGSIWPWSGGGSGSHATVGLVMAPIPPAPVYGSALPFDMRGGSGGGAAGSCPSQGNYGPPASGGGGTIAILAGGSIDVSGTVSARGGDFVLGPEYSWGLPCSGGLGSGGSVLLRSLQCVRVSGTIGASGGCVRILNAGAQPAAGGDGFIRIDSYTGCGAPDLTGATIHPAPLVAPLPFLTALEPARIGQIYRMRVASAPGDVLGLYYSLGTVLTPLPPFGVLELDPSLILFLGQFVVPGSGDDPLAVIDVAVPNTPSLVGVTLHSQVFNAFGTVTGQARLSNRLVTLIGQ
jgi:hypothetical protein